MSYEGLTHPHPHPSRHHPNRITTHPVPRTKLWPQHQSSKLRGRKDACLAILDKDWRENLSKCVVTHLFRFSLLSKCLHKDSTTETVGFFISLLSVDLALSPGCANWPSSCFSILEDWFFFFIIFMHAGLSLSADPSIGCRLIIPHRPWNSAPIMLLFSLCHIFYLLKICCTVLYVAKLDCSSWTHWQYLIQMLQMNHRKHKEEMLYSDLLLRWPSLIYLSPSGCRIGLFLDYGHYFKTHPVDQLQINVPWVDTAGD